MNVPFRYSDLAMATEAAAHIAIGTVARTDDVASAKNTAAKLFSCDTEHHLN